MAAGDRRILLALGDLFAINLSVYAALRIWGLVGDKPENSGFILSQGHWFALLSVLWLVLASANDFYDLALTARWAASQVRLIQITLQLLLVYLLIFFFSPRDALPRLFIIYYAGLGYLSVALWRLVRPILISWGPIRQRELIVGTGWPAKSIADVIRQYTPGDYEVVGCVTESNESVASELTFTSELILGGPNDIIRLATEHHIHEVILASTAPVSGDLFQAVMDCYEQGIRVRAMPLLYEQLTGRVPVEHVGGSWNVILPLEGRSAFDPYPLLKRLIDISVSIIGLVVLVVLFPVLAIAIYVDSPGPILFGQARVGKSGKAYNMWKFRTMIPDAESSVGPIWAVTNDRRITRVGQFLRKSRLDELPQLWNILVGEMSLIGPRPERQFFVERLQELVPFYRARLAVAPGLTGWAQVNHGYGNSVDDALIKLQYDLYYIRHHSLLLDMLIVLRTIGRVIRMQGT